MGDLQKCQTNKVNVYSVLSEIGNLNEEVSKIENKLIELLADVNEGSNIIYKASDEANYKIKGYEIPISKYSHKNIIDLMGDVEITHSKKIEIISDLISTSNNNTKILSNLITQLAFLSGMTFSSIENLALSLDNVDEIVDKNVKSTNRISSQLKEFIKKQLYRIIDDKNRYEYFLFEQNNLSKRIECLEKGNKELFDTLLSQYKEIINDRIEINEKKINSLLSTSSNIFQNIKVAESNFNTKLSEMDNSFRKELLSFANEKIEEQNKYIKICIKELEILKNKTFLDSYLYKIIIGITSITALILSLI